MLYESVTIRHSSVGALWDAFIAASTCFGTEMPSALNAGAIPRGATYAEAMPIALSEIARVATAHHVGDGKMPLADFEISVAAYTTSITFGSGRSAVRLILSTDENRLEIGLWLPLRELIDPEGAMISVRARFDAAERGIISWASTVFGQR